MEKDVFTPIALITVIMSIASLIFSFFSKKQSEKAIEESKTANAIAVLDSIYKGMGQNADIGFLRLYVKEKIAICNENGILNNIKTINNFNEDERNELKRNVRIL